MNAIDIKEISFAYEGAKDKQVLNDINIHIQAGEFVCILGQSGCGKSTLLRLLAGLEQPDDGQILIDGQMVKGAGLDRSIVFQDYGLFPWLTAGENIVCALKKKYPKEKKPQLRETARKMLKEVGLSEDVYDKYPRELSGGMKQRCAIAQAFSIDPPIMLMDEPFGALDAVTRARLQDMTLDLWKKEETRKTIVFVTHDVDEALLLANHIVVLGQAPSNIIFEVKIPEEEKQTRDTIFDDMNTMMLRSKLIKHINMDVSNHISEEK